MLDTFREIYYGLVDEADFDTYRYLYERFNTSDRLTGLVGPRGVGKTTLLLQYLRHRVKKQEEALYITADHIYFNKTSLFDFVKDVHESEGIALFVIDEVHKYAGWDQELKNIYDALPRVKIVFSGSSSLNLVKGSHDLSRRGSLYHLAGMSFREYLEFCSGEKVRPLTFETLLDSHETMTRKLSKVGRLKGYFRSYLEGGYYPFFLEGSTRYYDKVSAVVEKTIHEDIANFYSLNTENLHCFKKILFFLATIPPGKVNVHNLAKNLGVDDKTALHYLAILRDTGLVRLLFADAKGTALVRRPEKAYLDNPVLYSALCQGLDVDRDKGAVRELFFLNALENAGVSVRASKKGGDFVAKRVMFEIGGKTKGQKQIRDASGKALLVKDDILVGGPNTVPLYLFGFLY